MSLRKGFDSTILPEISPFKIDPDNFTMKPNTSKDGGHYDTYLLTISPKNSSNMFEVECFKRDAQRMRSLQYLNPDGYLTATWKAKTTEEGYDQLIISSAGAEEKRVS